MLSSIADHEQAFHTPQQHPLVYEDTVSSLIRDVQRIIIERDELKAENTELRDYVATLEKGKQRKTNSSASSRTRSSPSTSSLAMIENAVHRKFAFTLVERHPNVAPSSTARPERIGET